jgi:hypothetical protein
VEGSSQLLKGTMNESVGLASPLPLKREAQFPAPGSLVVGYFRRSTGHCMRLF